MAADDFKKRTTFLKKNFNSIAHEIKLINEQGRKIADDPDPSVTLMFKGMMKTIDDIFSRLTKNWEELMQLYISNDKEADFPSDAEKNTYANAKRYYYEANAKLVELSEANRPTTNPALNPENSLNATQSVPARARFPKLKLPTFSGKLAEWPIFRDNFEALIHKDANISKMDKYHYLIGYLSDRALDVIKSIPFLENNYDLAWKTLSETFDHKRTLASSYLNTLINFKPMTGKINADILQNFLSIVPPSIAAFKNLKIDKPEEYIFFELAVRILDAKTREAFELQNSKVDYPTFDALVEFVQARMRGLQNSTAEPLKSSNVETSKPPKSPRAFEPNGARVSVLSVSASAPNASTASKPTGLPTCKLCCKAHRIVDCPTLRQATPSERLTMLKTHRCCFNCLHPGQHTSSDCKSVRRCDQCQRRHHTLIHHAFSEKSPSNPTKEKDSTSPTAATTSVQLAACSNAAFESTSVLLGTAVVQARDAKGIFQPIRLVLDSGSQRSLITKACAQKLGLAPTQSLHKLVGIGQSTLNENLGQVNCTIKTDQRNRPLLSTTCLVVSTITGNLPQTTLPISTLEKLAGYKLADSTFWKPGPIDLLLGADMYGDVVTGKPIRISSNEPSVINTVFGRVVLGRCSAMPDSNSTVLLGCCTDADDVNTTLKRFWATEEPLTTKIVSPDDEWCENHFLETHHRLKTGRYVACLPFKGFQTSIGESRQQALTRFLRLETTLSKNPTAKKSYDEFLKEYLDLGHMTCAKAPGLYYLPHHAVKKVDDPEGKIRVVFDASAKASSGRSLNDCLHSGPKLQLDIADILLNFRRHKFVFTTDIKKMYRQILIDSSETKFQHILWRFQPNEEIRDYELLTLTYGMSCAPFIALRVIQQLIIDEGSSYPRAAEVLKTDIYIDDVVTGASSFDEALELIVQLIAMLRKGCFELGKWSSNSSELLERAAVTKEDSLINLANNEDQTVKILGLQWNSTIDSFSYKIREPPQGITKRIILSTTARLYDPLGFLSPVIFTAKKILQDLWIAGSGWDEVPPSKIAQRWTTYLTELPLLSQVDLPRFLRVEENANYTLLGFSDASEIGYCAAIYLRVEMASTVSIFLLKAKTKLAPLKPSLSVPRLELLGAKLLTTLLTSISPFRAHLQQPKVYLFTDSMTVLSWLKTPSHQLKMYVAQRVNAILEESEPTFWYHVRSKENPADIGSRGLMPSQIIDNDLWWTGAPWASLPPDQWPLQKTPIRPPEDLPDLKPERVLVGVTTTDWDIDNWTKRFSSYTRLIRSFCYVYRFLRRRQDKSTGPINSEEFQSALTSYLILLQKQFYSEKDTHQQNLFNILNVFQDTHGIFRVGGRLKNANLSFDERHPILLPRRCHFNTLLIDHSHKEHLHVGPQALLAILRRRYWIPAGKDLVKRQSRLCHVCFKWSAKPQPPYMGDLPVSRTFEQAVFHHVGVDFAGPLMCRESTRRNNTSGPSEQSVVAGLGLVIFRALDFGLEEEEERHLSPEMERLIKKMTDTPGPEDRTINETDDEGIERDQCDSFEETSQHSSSSLSLVLQECTVHMGCGSQEADSHYKAVCRALVAEALELSMFLENVGARQLRQPKETPDLYDKLNFNDWARLWVQVVRELRIGVQLKKVCYTRKPIEFELTPYEILMEDIRARRYKLNKVMVDGNIPQRVKKDAHAIILEFIRSRPPLKKASERKLNPPKHVNRTPRENLMEAIKQGHAKLSPIKRNTAKKEPISDITPKTDRSCITRSSRRLIKIDRSKVPSEEEDRTSDDDEGEESKSNPWQRTAYDLATQCPSRRASMRRHTVVVCESGNKGSLSVPQSRPTSRQTNTPTDESLSCTLPEMTWSRTSLQDDLLKSKQWQEECLSLTLEEIVHIRSVLTKAELESLPVEGRVKEDAEKRKVCFLCMKTRFGIFGPWGQICKLCKRTVCAKCYSKMRIPTEHFSHVPVVALSPSMLSPSESDDSFPRALVTKLMMTDRSGVGSAPTSPKLPRSAPPSQMSTSLISDGPISLPPSSPAYTSSDKWRIARTKTIGRTKVEKLKGLQMIVCHDCKTMVLQIIKSSRTTRSMAIRNLTLDLSPVY